MFLQYGRQHSALPIWMVLAPKTGFKLVPIKPTGVWIEQAYPDYSINGHVLTGFIPVQNISFNPSTV